MPTSAPTINSPASDIVSCSTNGYTAVIVQDDRTLEKIYHLRSQVYCDELRWVEDDGSGLEHDAFDLSATHYAVLDPMQQVVATIQSGLKSWIRPKLC